MATVTGLARGARRLLSEKEIFLKTGTGTRYIRLTVPTQIAAVGALGLLVGWSVFSVALFSFDALGAGSLRERTEREREVYETKIAEMAAERDARAAETRRAQARFTAAMHAVSEMQGQLLASEEEREELETGLETVHATLRRTMVEREAARAEAEMVLARYEATTAETGNDAQRAEETTASLDLLSDVLARTAVERDAIAAVAAEARAHVDDLILEQRLVAEKNDRIFARLEEAMNVSVAPLGEMFRRVGLDPDAIIATVRSGRDVPEALGPIRLSTKGETDADAERANAILARLGDMDVYREAAERTPFSRPVKAQMRHTSEFGPRWGRQHEGQDFAGAHGTSIYSTADGTVVFAGRQSGYGNLIKIRHQFGIETRYAHLSGIHVKVGQQVSRGDLIGDMGSTGNSTGTHLHYEVRMNGRAVDPMTYIRAAQDVL